MTDNERSKMEERRGEKSEARIHSTWFDSFDSFDCTPFDKLREGALGGFLIGYFHPGFGDCPTVWAHCRPFPSNSTLALSMSILTIFTFFV
jgi:hypothetical protein